MPDTVNNYPFSHDRIAEPNPGMWQDFYVQGRPFGKMAIYYDDFSTYIADAWTVTEVGTPSQNIIDGRNGILSLISSGAENDGSNLQLGGSADGETTGISWAPAAGKNLFFEIGIATAAWTQHEIFVGIHSQDISVAESRGADYIGFSSRDGNAYIDAECAASSVISNQTNIFTQADSATVFVKLGFKVSQLTKVEYYVNDILKATTTTNIPTANMKLTIAHTAGEAVAKTLNVDYVFVGQDR